MLCGLLYLLPGKPSHIWRIRRQMRRKAFPGRPRWQWWLLRCALFLSWYAVAGWLALGRGWRMASRLPGKERVPLRQLLSDLLHLILRLGAEPGGYFVFRLHSRPRAEWEAFVFPQEQLIWQAAEGQNDEAGRKALADKDIFANRLRNAGLPSVPTVRRWRQGASVEWGDLTDSVFVKPNSANGMRGCFELVGSKDRFHLTGKDLKGRPYESDDREAITDCLNELLRETDCLIQPLLRNHPALLEIVPSERLITLRVISIRRSEPELLYAVLEIPTDEANVWLLANINAETGEISESRNQLQPDESIRDAFGKVIPQWDVCRDIIRRAHELVPDLVTVGWDLAITESGPMIIEGNPGWDVVPPQAVSGVPLLRALEMIPG